MMSGVVVLSVFGGCLLIADSATDVAAQFALVKLHSCLLFFRSSRLVIAHGWPHIWQRAVWGSHMMGVFVQPP